MSSFVWPRGVAVDLQAERSGNDARDWVTDPAKQTVVRFFGIYSEQAPDRLPEVISETYRDYGHPSPGIGLAGARADYDGLTDAFSNVTYLLHDMVREGDRVAVRWTATMTHSGEFFGRPATGKRITLAGFSFYRVVDGRIAATWNLQDVSGLHAQIEQREGHQL